MRTWYAIIVVAIALGPQCEAEAQGASANRAEDEGRGPLIAPGATLIFEVEPLQVQ